MKITACILVFLIIFGFLTGCHPSNASTESGKSDTPAATQETTLPKESLPDNTLTRPALDSDITPKPQLDTAILKAFCDMTDRNFLTEGSEMQVSHYAEFDGIYAVYVDGPWIYTQAIRNVTVYGCKFVFPSGQRMYLYRDGQICAVDDAEAKKFATEDEIKSLWTIYRDKSSNLYGGENVKE